MYVCMYVCMYYIYYYVSYVLAGALLQTLQVKSKESNDTVS